MGNTNGWGKAASHPMTLLRRENICEQKFNTPFLVLMMSKQIVETIAQQRDAFCMGISWGFFCNYHLLTEESLILNRTYSLGLNLELRI